MNNLRTLIAIFGGIIIVLVGIMLFSFAPQKEGDSEEVIIPEPEVSETTTGLYSSFINVHLEPESADEMESHWGHLENLINTADTYEIPLVLHFSESWAIYALENEDELSKLRSWEENGHEIGMHNHGFSHANWDGYSNAPATKKLSDYKGTIEDLMNIMNQLTASGQILSASMTDEDTDWAEGLLYRTTNDGGGSGPTPDDMIGIPSAEILNGHEVTRLGKMGFAIDMLQTQLTVADIEEIIANAEEGEILGITLNDNSMEENMIKVKALFMKLQEWGTPVQTVSDILDDYPYSY